jgi:hypothetical protein
MIIPFPENDKQAKTFFSRLHLEEKMQRPKKCPDKKRENKFLYHETEVTPLVKKIPVDIDTVGFGQVLGDQLPDGRQILGLLAAVITDILKIQRTGGRHFLRLTADAEY